MVLNALIRLIINKSNSLLLTKVKAVCAPGNTPNLSILDNRLRAYIDCFFKNALKFADIDKPGI